MKQKTIMGLNPIKVLFAMGYFLQELATLFYARHFLTGELGPTQKYKSPK